MSSSSSRRYTGPSSGYSYNRDPFYSYALSAADAAENEHDAIWWGNGHGLSPADWTKMAYDRQLELDDRVYKAERWEIENSMQGLVDQYKDAGMNPILATGVQPTSGASASPAPSSSSSGGSDPLGGALGIISSLLGFSTQVSGAVNQSRSTSQEIKESKAREDNYIVDSLLILKVQVSFDNFSSIRKEGARLLDIQASKSGHNDFTLLSSRIKLNLRTIKSDN